MVVEFKKKKKYIEYKMLMSDKHCTSLMYVWAVQTETWSGPIW